MQRYQPPHMRQRAAQEEQQRQAEIARGGPTVAGGRPSAQAGPSFRPVRPGPLQNASITVPTSYAPRPSRKDWSTPPRSTGYTLASPASDLQPMRRTPAKDIDDMDLIQSVSRSGGDGAEGDALKDWEMQERYRRYIDEKIDKHHATHKRARHTPPPSTETDELYSLGSIVLLFRKLREGVLASDRLDDFAIEVFESSARMAILARNTAQLISAVSGLVPGLYADVDLKGKSRAGPNTDNDLATGLDGLSIADNRTEFASILLLFQLAHVGSRQTYHSTLVDLTAPTSLRLRRQGLDGAPVEYTSPTRHPFIRSNQLRYAQRAARALAEETFDPITYFRLISDTEAASAYERAVLAWAEDSVRARAWKVLARSYISCERGWAGRWCGREGVQVDRWAEKEGGRVEGTVIKLR